MNALRLPTGSNISGNLVLNVSQSGYVFLLTSKVNGDYIYRYTWN